MDDLEAGGGHTERLIATYRRRLDLLELQQARFGWRTDPGMIMEIEEIQATMAALRTRRGAPAPAGLRALAPQTERPPRHRGLMVLVGTGRAGVDPLSQSAGAAIAYHFREPSRAGLERCWLIPSGAEPPTDGQEGDQTHDAAIVVARALERRCAEQGVAARIWPVAEAFSIQDTYDLVQWLFAYDVPALGLAEHEVICDFTGGTKLMAAGMILACGARRPMQYMVRDPDSGAVPLRVGFAPEGGR
jgi:hypothetical protein